MNSILYTYLMVLLSALMVRPLPPQQAAKPTDENSPENVNVCELKSNPGKYNHRLVQVTGFVSHGFEDFAVYDPTCSEWPQIWLEYGGATGSNTMYCCGIAPKQARGADLTVENIK